METVGFPPPSDMASLLSPSPPFPLQGTSLPPRTASPLHRRRQFSLAKTTTRPLLFSHARRDHSFSAWKSVYHWRKPTVLCCSRSGQRDDIGGGRRLAVESLVLRVCQAVKMEMFVKPILQIFLSLRDGSAEEFPTPACIGPSRFLLPKRRASPSLHPSFSGRIVVSRALLSVAVFMGTVVSLSFLHRPCPAAYAAVAQPAMETSSQSYSHDNVSESYSGKFTEGEAEAELRYVYMQSMFQEVYQRLRREKVFRGEAESRFLVEPGKKRREIRPVISSSSTREQRVLGIMDSTFHEYVERLQQKAGSSASYFSSYEDNLRQVFDAISASLQRSRKESAYNEGELTQMTKELLSYVRVEDMGLQIRVFRDMEKARVQLKAEKTRLTNKLTEAVKRHFSLQERLEMGGSDEDIRSLDMEIAQIWERMLDVRAEMFEMETGSFRAAVKKLPSLEQRVEEIVGKLVKDKNSSLPVDVEGGEAANTKAVNKEVQEKVTEDLSVALKGMLVHKFLPKAIKTNEHEPSLDEQTKTLLDKLKRQDESSKNVLETVDKMIQEDIRAESRMLEDEAGQGNLVVAPSLQRMEEEKKEALKQYLKNNPEFGRLYAAEKQESILKCRDRVLADVFYNEREKRWEMPPQTLKYAVDKEFLESVQIRQDRGAMCYKLKGDDRTFFADLQVYDDIYLNYGGADSLHLKILGSGIPVSVEYMRIPFSQLDPIRVSFLPFKLLFSNFIDLVKFIPAKAIVLRYFKYVTETFEEFLGRLFFPILERFPKLFRIWIGLQLPDNAPPRSEIPVLLELRKQIQKIMEERYGQGESTAAWWISLPVKCYVLWIPFTYFTRIVVRVWDQFFGTGEGMNEVEWKEKKGKEIMKKLKADNPKAIEDPVRKAFDRMKIIKKPELRLQDFAGLDMVKDEINEIVTFLREPSIFKEMGARPPRGVLIVGEPGTGKTSLAMAIAAEARVPVVELDGMELEGGAWVGQGASNVRDLFKTARELAPLIIFMDDFDYFAGVRGDSGDTRKQDHESLINQLLVELDGFETQEGVVLLATCSRPDSIDEALRRPGRMDRTITLPMPNKVEREFILRKSAEATMDDDLIELVDWKEMARKTDGMTPQQLKAVPRGLESSFASWKYTDDEELFTIFKWLVKLNNITPGWVANSKWMKSWKSSLRDWLGLKVTKEDVEAAVACIDVFNESQPGIEYSNPGYIWTREFKFPHAVWAAGRSLVAALLPNFDVVENVWLDKSSWEGIGFTRFSKRREGGYEETKTLTRSYCEKKLVLCFGSSIAARLLLPYGEQNDLSKYEIQEAKQIATSMVLEYGWGPDNSPTVYTSSSKDVTLSMGDELELELEAKARELYEVANDRAAEMIAKNRNVLDALLEHLLQFDAISKKDLARLMQENGAIFEEDPFDLVPYKDVSTEQQRVLTPI